MQYCERVGPGLFDEPVNAVTNAAFFVAAWAAWSLAKQRNALSMEMWVLIGLCVSVGVGSLLWHTFASAWAHPLDVIPILLFQLSFIWVYGRRQLDLRWYVIILVLLGYVGAALLGRQHRQLLNGVLIYAPTVLLSLTVGFYHWWADKREPLLLLAAAGAFLLALFFRTIDLWVCPRWPLGTHFLWHVLNGIVVYLTLRSLIVNNPTAGGPVA